MWHPTGTPRAEDTTPNLTRVEWAKTNGVNEEQIPPRAGNKLSPAQPWTWWFFFVATRVGDVSPQAVHACVKAEAQDSCLKCCGSKYLTYYSLKEVVDLLLCFDQARAFPLSKVSYVLYIPNTCKGGNASCQSNQSLFISPVLGVVTSLSHIELIQKELRVFEPCWIIIFFFLQHPAEEIGFHGLNGFRGSSELSQLCDFDFPSWGSPLSDWGSREAKQVLGLSCLCVALVICSGQTIPKVKCRKNMIQIPKSPLNPKGNEKGRRRNGELQRNCPDSCLWMGQAIPLLSQSSPVPPPRVWFVFLL